MFIDTVIKQIQTLRRNIKSFFLYSLNSYKFRYFFASFLSYIINLYLKKSEAEEKKYSTNNIKRVLIIYSKRHFDPSDDSNDKTFSKSSAANIARNIYYAFSEKKETYYIDKDDETATIPKVDLIIGILGKNFVRSAKLNPSAKKILFLVNSHPLFRLKALINESKKLGKIFPHSEYISPIEFTKAQFYTDKMILIGNKKVRQTYIERGVEERDIYLINSGVNLETLTPISGAKDSDKIRIIYPGSHLAIRKGVFRVMEIWAKLMETIDENSVELFILGKSDVFSQDILNFQKKYKNVSYIGWVDSSTEEYVNLLRSSHIMIAPSIEEGQVGCALESMACGCVPIITEICGIAISDKEGFLIKDHTDVDRFVEKIREMIVDREKLDSLSSNARLFIEKNHNWDSFRKTIRKISLK